MFFFLRCLLLLIACLSTFDIEGLLLRDKLSQAEIGDFVVTAQGKSYTLLQICNRDTKSLTIEEISIPANKVPQNMSWSQWLKQGAPSHTSWLRYVVNLSTGSIDKSFSKSKQGWLEVTQKNETFLPTLMSLQFSAIPISERRKIGPAPERGSPDRRRIWQPKMVFNGHVIPNIEFEGWQALWPQDGGELAGKVIEIYLPKENGCRYPSYFPYWLQVCGSVAKATLRIIDSGTTNPSG